MRFKFAPFLCLATVLGFSACESNVTSPSAPPVSLAVNGPIAGSYIIVLKQDSTKDEDATVNVTRRLIRQFGGRLRFQYIAALHGFAVDGISSAVAQAIAKHPAVAYVEADQVTHMAGTQTSPGSGCSAPRFVRQIQERTVRSLGPATLVA